ncbi:MAG: site-2 protease family protein [Eubacteriales bacterium]
MFLNNLSLEDIIYRIPAIIIGFTLHEFMHAYVADKLGDPTPRNHGRLSLNPLVHIDWIGFFMLLIAGFGWAKPVYTNPRNYKNYKKGRLLVSIAGPLANLALAFVGFAIAYYTRASLPDDNFWMKILSEFVWINTILFAFNLIPIPPLDGFTLLELWIKPEKYALINKFRAYGIIIVLILSFAGILEIYLRGVYKIIYLASNWVFIGIDALTGLF